MLIELDKYFPMNSVSISIPNIYLCEKFSKVVFPNGVDVYSFSSSQYIHKDVKNVEENI